MKPCRTRVRARLASSALLLVTFAACQAPVDSTPHFTTGDTIYEGLRTEDGAVESFLGIPFAQAPVGAGRWQAPQPLSPVRGHLPATQFAPACMQGPHMVRWYRNVAESFGGDPMEIEAPTVAEDCLYLNIWRPTEARAGSLPVVVYIHGGSNKGGWSFEPNYMGEGLARKDVVVVSIAYRLGVFGFLVHPGLEQLNFALLDQIAALQWIHTHIAAAGGDPRNVTVMGESSGASNIGYLLVSPRTRGLFHRAIHQSAGWALLEPTDFAEHERRGIELIAAVSAEEGLTGARAADAAAVLAAAESVYQDHTFDPVVDGEVIPESPATAFPAENFAPVDILIGSNSDEWRMYLDPEEAISRWTGANLSPAKAAAVHTLLAKQEDSEIALDQLITAYNYVCPSLGMAEAIGANEGRAWVYYFARQREGEQAATMGAYHGAELPYVFGTHDSWLPTEPDDLSLGESMMTYWANFIRSGDPNSEGLRHWRQFSRDTESVQILDTRISTARHPGTALCAILMPQ